MFIPAVRPAHLLVANGTRLDDENVACAASKDPAKYDEAQLKAVLETIKLDPNSSHMIVSITGCCTANGYDSESS